MASFHSFLYSSLLAVIAVTETWLSQSIFDNEVLPNGYSVYRKDRQYRGGGGILIGTASHISSSFLYSQSDPDVLLSSPFFPSPIIIMCLLLRLICRINCYFISESSIPVVMFQLFSVLGDILSRYRVVLILYFLTFLIPTL